MADLHKILTGEPPRERRARSAGARVGRYVAHITRAGRRVINYVQGHDFPTIRRDAESGVRARPVRAVLLGIGAGYIAAKLIRR